jgi:hypothetical protein
MLVILLSILLLKMYRVKNMAFAALTITALSIAIYGMSGVDVYGQYIEGGGFERGGQYGLQGFDTRIVPVQLSGASNTPGSAVDLTGGGGV